jgi:hypothetical protein
MRRNSKKHVGKALKPAGDTQRLSAAWEWAKAALATAQKTGDLALIQKATENALAAAAELNERVRAAAVAFSRAVRLNGTRSRAPSCLWELASYVRQTPADAP